MQGSPSTPSLHDSVVAGDLHTGDVIHHHHHYAAAPTPAPAQVAFTPTTMVQHVAVPVVPSHRTVPVARMPGEKDILLSYIFWLFIGVFGGHRFYLNRPLSGVLFLVTFGFLGIGWLVDAALIPGMVEHSNIRAQHRMLRAQARMPAR